MNLVGQRFLAIATAVAIATISLFTATNIVDAKPPQSTTEFVIEAKLDGGNAYNPLGNWYEWGRFRATGAVHDNGRAFATYDVDLGLRVMELYGKGGDIDIALWSDDNGERFFTIISATGEHSGLVGITGTVSEYVELNRKGDISIYRTLYGSIGL
jgi:hypothetical protein